LVFTDVQAKCHVVEHRNILQVITIISHVTFDTTFAKFYTLIISDGKGEKGC